MLPLRIVRCVATTWSRSPPSCSASSPLSPASLLRAAGASRSRFRAMASYSSGSGKPQRLLFRQLFEKESSTYTYLLADLGHPEKPAVVRAPIDYALGPNL
uniref:Uncharacterized protein n=1 Tax=Ananas comosus var. bracteatus TaxID=296719 RepID=A0A6V7NYY1_ANACO|nr:unnamed protein product [Ananas comosus var. bracteatus]